MVKAVVCGTTIRGFNSHHSPFWFDCVDSDARWVHRTGWEYPAVETASCQTMSASNGGWNRVYTNNVRLRGLKKVTWFLSSSSSTRGGGFRLCRRGFQPPGILNRCLIGVMHIYRFNRWAMHTLRIYMLILNPIQNPKSKYAIFSNRRLGI